MQGEVSTLNAAQMTAVHHVDGPCLVLAGAGSGKTRVITHKIARLLGAGLLPQQIAAITFTNKAAAEMRERVKALVGARSAKDVLISTFHALGVRILREDGQHLGLKTQFSILDSDDVLSILRDAGGTTDVAVARRWQWAISQWKNQGWTPEQAAAAAQDETERVAAAVMVRYQERLQAYQAVDFDDLIQGPVALLSAHDPVRHKWQTLFGHVLVDEYQDTNAQQYALLKLLVGDRAHLTAVGDDDQSIYGWRGATIENLKRLPQDFPHLRVIPLEQNYRSTGHILRAANHVIAANPKIFNKRLWSEYGDGDPVRVMACDNEEHEAQCAVARIQSLRANPPQGQTPAATAWKDFALLYRANHQARVLEQALRRAQIPYRVSGGQSFFDRAEIKDLCAWLRLLVNPDDDPAFLRAVTTPKRGIGHQSLAQLGAFAGQWKVSMFEALFADSLHAAVSPRALASLHEFGRYVSELQDRARHATGSEAARDFLNQWLQDIAYEQHLYDGESQDKAAAARWAHVVDFVDWVAKRCGNDPVPASGFEGSPKRSVLEVAQSISVIISLIERGNDQDMVTLSTLHAAKGLEWPHVILIGVNEGLLPFFSDDEDLTPERLEEERRLMYVGITRARQTLAVSTLRRRKKGREFIAAQPSRFVAEMQLDAATAQEDPREKLKALQAEFTQRAARSPLNRPV